MCGSLLEGLEWGFQTYYDKFFSVGDNAGGLNCCKYSCIESDDSKSRK